MGVAFSNEADPERIAYYDLLEMPHTAADAIEAIRPYFLYAEWTETPIDRDYVSPVNSSWTWTDTGYRYLLQSPQLLTVILDVFYTSGPGTEPLRWIYFQMLSNDGSGTNKGRKHELYIPPDAAADAGVLWTIWCNPCQFFISRDKDPKDTMIKIAIAGGIPYINPSDLGPGAGGECSYNFTQAISEAWWMCDNRNTESIRYMAGPWRCWSGCVNGAVRTHPDMDNGDAQDVKLLWHGMRLLTLNWYQGSPVDFEWYDNRWRGQWIDPMIAWSLDTGHTDGPVVIGQLWDAFIETRRRDLNDVKTTNETSGVGGVYSKDWFNWGYPYFAGTGSYSIWDITWTSYSLYLLKPEGGPFIPTPNEVRRNYLF